MSKELVMDVEKCISYIQKELKKIKWKIPKKVIEKVLDLEEKYMIKIKIIEE